jgi:hypothetical protein
MALPTLSSLVTGLEARMGLAAGSLDGVDLVRAQEVLTDASMLVQTELLGSVPDHPSVKVVILAAGKRAYLNMSDVQSETMGLYVVVWGDRGVGLTASEQAILSRIKGSTSQLWTLGTTRSDYLEATRFLLDEFGDGTMDGGDLIPFEERYLS